MNFYVYAIYDELTGEFSRVFTAPNDLVAARIFLSMQFNPGEKLYFVGVFSPSSGSIEGSEPQVVDIEEIVLKIKKQIADRKALVKEVNGDEG